MVVLCQDELLSGVGLYSAACDNMVDQPDESQTHYQPSVKHEKTNKTR